MDIEVVDDGKPDNSRELNETMSKVQASMLSQLESLQAIARWQDQTALYTSHLQNIKVDMNQVRKWGEPINRIATRVDHMSTTLDAIAAKQIQPGDDDDSNVDAKALLPALNQIAQNTKETADNINVLAMAIREDQEDKREVKEKVKPEKDTKNKKEKEKAEGTVRTAFDQLTSFFKKLMGWIGVSLVALVPIFMGSDRLFAQLNTFFKSVFGFFVGVTKFFMQNVAPAINFLFEGLVTFFNKLTGPLGRLGTEIGNQLKIIGPKLFNAINPILDFIGNGIIKAVDFFTSVVALIGPAIDTISQFVSDISKKFQSTDSELTAKVGGFFEYIERLFQKIMGSDPESLMVSFRNMLNMMYNGVLDMAQKVVLTMMHVRLFLDDTYGLAEFDADYMNRVGGLEKAKIMSPEEMTQEVDRLGLNTNMSDRDILKEEEARLLEMQDRGEIDAFERRIRLAALEANLPQLREAGQVRGRTRIGELEKGDVKTVDLGTGGNNAQRIEINNVQSVIPDFPYNYAKANVTTDGKVIYSSMEYGSSEKDAVNSGNLATLDDDNYSQILGLFKAVYRNPDAVGEPIGGPPEEESPLVDTNLSSLIVPDKSPAKFVQPPPKGNSLNLVPSFADTLSSTPSGQEFMTNFQNNIRQSLGGSSSVTYYSNYGIDLNQIAGIYDTVELQ